MRQTTTLATASVVCVAQQAKAAPSPVSIEEVTVTPENPAPGGYFPGRRGLRGRSPVNR